MADRTHTDGRTVWEIVTPPGGWHAPWPQCIELVTAIGPERWTLVGGLMVQLHSARAGLAVTRPTADVEVVVHIETGQTTMNDIAEALLRLGYQFQPPNDKDGAAHRFVRGDEQVDVMVPRPAAPPRPGGTVPRVVDALGSGRPDPRAGQPPDPRGQPADGGDPPDPENRELARRLDQLESA